MADSPSVNDYSCETDGLDFSSPPAPYYSYSSPPPPSSSSSSSSLSAAAAGGIGAGVLVIIIIVIVVVVICCCKKKRKPVMAAGGQNNYYAAGAPAAAQAKYAYPVAAAAAAASPTPAAGPTGAYYDPAKPQWQQNNNPSPPAAHYMSPQPSAPNSQGWQPQAAFHASPPSSGPYSQGTQPPAKPYMSPPSSGPYPQEQQPPAPYSSDQQTTTSVSSYGSKPPTNNSSGTVGPPKPRKQALGFSMNIFNYEELAQATDGFVDSNILGQGGFGYVHKGVLPNGMEVAVKSLRADSRQGDNEFEAEIETVSRVHHRYLVSLVGYCVTDAHRLLVYEYIPNGTLQYHLHAKGVPTLTWATRMKIALGSARGLAYLHEDCRPKIIHRDIKAANILLDFDFEAKVADFGLAKFTTDQSTHVSTRVMGTFGYLAPEYAASGKLTEKSDVFSFGVMLLELITGRLPHDMKAYDMDDSMVDWAKPLLQRALEDGNFDPLIDPKFENKYNHEEVMRMITCAAASVRHSAKRRPKMSQIVRALEGNMALADLNDGVSPGHSIVYSSQTGSEYNTAEYKKDLERFRQMVTHGIPKTDVTSSEYDGSYPSGSTSGGGGQISRESELGKLKDGR